MIILVGLYLKERCLYRKKYYKLLKSVKLTLIFFHNGLAEVTTFQNTSLRTLI